MATSRLRLLGMPMPPMAALLETAGRQLNEERVERLLRRREGLIIRRSNRRRCCYDQGRALRFRRDPDATIMSVDTVSCSAARTLAGLLGR